MNINIFHWEVKFYLWYLWTPARIVADIYPKRRRRPFLPVLAPCQSPCPPESIVSTRRFHSFPRRFLSFGSVSTPSASRKLMSMPSLFSRSVSFKTQYLYEWERKTQVRQTLCAIFREEKQGGVVGGLEQRLERKERKSKKEKSKARTKGGPSPTSIGVL